MKVLFAKQIREWDAYTIQKNQITSIGLMEMAAAACKKYIDTFRDDIGAIHLFCGTGNNGGDGVTMAANWKADGLKVKVYIVGNEEAGTNDFKNQLEKAKKLKCTINYIQSQTDFPEMEKTDLIIDALFGSGLNRPLSGIFAETVEFLNNSAIKIISIDVPSGMFIDRSSKGNTIIKANETLSFQTIKLCFLMAENAPFFGKVSLLDIGLHPAYLNEISAPQWVDGNFAGNIYKKRMPFSHKGNYGHSLIIAGNYGKMGAALLCAKACLKSGAGLVTLNTPMQFLNAVHAFCPELMCTLREEKENLSVYNSIAIGPGMGTDLASKELLVNVLKQFHFPVLIDADAITILSTIDDPLKLLPENSIITPHPREFDRLFGESENDFERMNKAVEVTKNHPVILVLKGHKTIISFQGKLWFNSTGNAGLAKGGSGDVLSGIICSLLAQKYTALQAAILGVYLHGLSADIAAKEIALESIIATEIIDFISEAYLTFN